VTTAANVHDSHALPWLLHGRERCVWRDAAYTGQRAVLRACAPHVRDLTQRKAGRDRPLSRAERARNRGRRGSAPRSNTGNRVRASKRLGYKHVSSFVRVLRALGIKGVPKGKPGRARRASG